MNPRKPTQEEKDQLIQYMVLNSCDNPTQDEEQQQEEFVEDAAIAVFDHYQTDGPGYCGKLMVVVWSGSPGMNETFIWNGEEIELCPNEK